MLFVPACITFRQLVASFFPKMTIFRHLTLEFFHIICQAWRKQDTSSMRRTFPLPAVAVVTTKSVKSLYIHQKSLELEQKRVGSSETLYVMQIKMITGHAFYLFLTYSATVFLLSSPVSLSVSFIYLSYSSMLRSCRNFSDKSYS